MISFRLLQLLQIFCGLAVFAQAFVARPAATNTPATTTMPLRSTATPEDTTTTIALPDLDAKEVVKVFGRLAEKYIMLDESGGMCCYSACKDCEYRLPDGGYRMADQSASRPKWIPVYEERVFANQNKEHTAKWATEIFDDDAKVTREIFAQKVSELEFATPLGGPFVSKSAGGKPLEDLIVAECLFDVLAKGKDSLSKRQMSKAMEELSSGEAGLTWPAFSAALGL